MGYKVELKKSKGYQVSINLVDDNEKKRKVGSYSFSIHGVRLIYDSTVKIFAGDTLNGTFDLLPVFRRFKNNSLESRTAKLFLKIFSMGSKVGTIDVVQERVF